MKTYKSLAALAVAAVALTGCSSISGDSASSKAWEPAGFPESVMSKDNPVIPDGTYNFTFTSTLPNEADAIAEAISASGRVTLKDGKCEMTADVKATVGATETTYQVIKPAGKAMHVFDGASKQWVNDPVSLAFMPLLTVSGAGAAVKAEDYSSLCVLNAYNVFLEQSKDPNQSGTFTVNQVAYEQFLKANADWYVDEIVKALKYAGDTREKAIPVFQKLFRFDALDTKAGADTIFTRIGGQDGSITIESGKGRNFDGGTFVLTPTEEPVSAVLPKDGIPSAWAAAIASGVEFAGSLDNYIAGKFPEDKPASK